MLDRDTIQVDKIYEKMTGLRAAFEAFRKIKADKEELLPGFETMTKYKLFFLSYAEVSRISSTPRQKKKKKNYYCIA